jgi:ATP-dependent Clp protease ATP-binding subunit ClpB
VYFNHLSEEHFKSIARLMLNELRDAMAEKPIDLTFDDSLLDYLTKKSYSLAYGARNLRRMIQKEIEDKIAARMIENYTRPVKMVSLSAIDDEIHIVTA